MKQKKRIALIALALLICALLMALGACKSPEDAAQTDSDTGVSDAAASETNEPTTDPPVPSGGVEPEEAEGVVVVLADVSDTVSFLPVNVDGTDMEVIAVKASDGSVRVALNTCRVCYDSGKGYYEQSGTNLICQNCGSAFAIDDIGIVNEGCSAIGLTESEIARNEDTITISLSTLEGYSQYFKNWK